MGKLRFARKADPARYTPGDPHSVIALECERRHGELTVADVNWIREGGELRNRRGTRFVRYIGTGFASVAEAEVKRAIQVRLTLPKGLGREESIHALESVADAYDAEAERRKNGESPGLRKQAREHRETAERLRRER